MIYFIQEPTELLIKIGYSTRISERVQAIARERWAPVTLLAQMDGDLKDEKRIHKQFSESRVRGEWFSPAPGLLDRIAMLNADPSYGWRWLVEAGRPLPEDDTISPWLVRKWRDDIQLSEGDAAHVLRMTRKDYRAFEAEGDSRAIYTRHQMERERARYES